MPGSFEARGEMSGRVDMRAGMVVVDLNVFEKWSGGPCVPVHHELRHALAARGRAGKILSRRHREIDNPCSLNQVDKLLRPRTVHVPTVMSCDEPLLRAPVDTPTVRPVNPRPMSGSKSLIRLRPWERAAHRVRDPASRRSSGLVPTTISSAVAQRVTRP